jgi:hypothetical protein
MRKIIVSSNSHELKSFLKDNNEKFDYIILNKEFMGCHDLLNKTGCQQINIENLGSESKDKFMQDYIDLIGKLSNKYNSIYWWATTISSKNPFISELYPNTFYYCHIIRYIEDYPDNNIIILSKNHIINENIEKYCIKYSINYAYLGKKRNILQEFLNITINFGANVILYLYQTWKKKYLIHKYLDVKIKTELKPQEKYYVLRSWFYDKSISSDMNYADSYFGGLHQYLAHRHKNLIVIAGIMGNSSVLIKKMAKCKDILIIPQEYFIGYLDYILISIKTFLNRIKIDTRCILGGVDVTDLIKEELKRNYRIFEIPNNIIRYYLIKRLIEQIKIDTFVFTFENHSWEKMCVLAFKKYSTKTKTIGYQHASISKSYLNFFPSEFETEIIPLPDKIISLGTETKRILEKYGSYPEDRIRVGCALRFEYLHKSKKFDRKKRNFIFVALTISKYESKKLINFIHNSLSSDKKYKVILRSHPATPFSGIEKELGFKLSENFQASTNVSMLDDFERSDIVLYTGTTVCMEALMMGLPVIHIDLGEPISVDPLFECNHLKWTVKHPDELIPAIDEIYNLDEDEFKHQQKLARKYVENYFLPVTDERMEEFL